MGYPEMHRSVNPVAHGIHEDFGTVCYGACPDGMRPVIQHQLTGRWYIAAGHPGFNLPANNGRGYASPAAALAAMRRCCKR